MFNESKILNTAAEVPEYHADSEVVQEALRMAAETEAKRIKLESFRGKASFTDEEIDRDLSKIEQIEAGFADKKRKHPQTPEDLEREAHGKAAEFMFRHGVSDYGWLAEKVNVIVASLFDDYVRGIDAVAQVELGDGKFDHVGFAMDFSLSTQDIGHKLMTTFDALDQGYSPHVKYFDSPKTGPIKSFAVARIAVGADKKTLDRLASYTAEIFTASGASAEAKQEIANDPFQLVLFGEIIAQLDTFTRRLQQVAAEARNKGEKDLEARAIKSANMHGRTLSTVMSLLAAKGFDLKDIHKQIQGDRYAVELGKTLSQLSQLPIGFGLHEQK